MKLTINPAFNIGERVYLITDPEQLPRMITRYLVGKKSLLYEVSVGEGLSYHHDYELSDTINVFGSIDYS